MASRKGLSEHDVERAVRGVRSAGLDVERVEVEPSGRINVFARSDRNSPALTFDSSHEPAAPSMAAPPLAKAVYTPTDLAERWNVTTAVVLAAMKRGDLVAFKLGARLYRAQRVRVAEYEDRFLGWSPNGQQGA